ncbi:radical SAM family heme chaperone HemW [Clostridium botulinum]|uniref:Heme chaperone HemW n=1 Tax=Clostridium botulinum TaxID=1491 RepID=A0A6M0SRD7_CLOBO|nr:radical SAM family heme chaperone HemW [Clostridium botulinum]
MKNYKVYYPNREIGVSHYPMPASKAKVISPENIEFLKFTTNKQNQVLLYIHIPFCEKVCSFCPYNKILYDNKKVEEYLKCLYTEIEWYSKEDYVQKSVINAIYFGGGTPNLLTTEQISNLIAFIKKKFILNHNAEITVEGNSHKFTETKIKALKDMGVNRISLGVQTFNTQLGQLLEVPHTCEDAIRTIKSIKDIGIEKLSIDLMYNIPNQSIASWMEDIKKAVELKIDHITLFHLILIPQTKLFYKVQNNEMIVHDLDGELEMYEKAMNYLLKAGYHQESTYDFALENKGSVYGIKHFKDHNDILGLGLGSFGEINNYCYINDGKFDNYISTIQSGKLPILLQDHVNDDEKINALMSMGLRMLEVDLKSCEVNVFSQFAEQIMVLAQNKLIEITDGKIRLTTTGKLWGNNICKEFYSDKYKQKLPSWKRMEELAKIK